jgi:hypothetical protein
MPAEHSNKGKVEWAGKLIDAFDIELVASGMNNPPPEFFKGTKSFTGSFTGHVTAYGRKIKTMYPERVSPN